MHLFIQYIYLYDNEINCSLVGEGPITASRAILGKKAKCKVVCLLVSCAWESEERQREARMIHESQCHYTNNTRLCETS